MRTQLGRGEPPWGWRLLEPEVRVILVPTEAGDGGQQAANFGDCLAMAGAAAQERIRRVAYHEAGHAVAFTIEGAGVEYVRIVHRLSASLELPSIVGAEAGACMPRRYGPAAAGLDLRWSHVAGVAAERLAGYTDATLSPADHRLAREALRRYLNPRTIGAESARLDCDPDALYEQRLEAEIGAATREASGLLRRHWAAVEGVASVLMRAGELDGAEAEGIIDRTLR